MYAGASCPTSAALACNDDACGGYESSVSWTAVAGQSYVIQIGLYPGNSPTASPGSGQFTLSSSSTPANDACTSATAIAGFGSFAFDDVAATTGTQGQAETACNLTGAGTAILQDVWYAWTSHITGDVRFGTCGSGVDTKIAVYSGTGCPSAPALACNDDWCGTNGFQSSALVAVVAGATYTVQLGLYPGSVPAATGGIGSLEVSDATAPANDDCSAATAIAGSGTFAYDSTLATTGAQGQSEAACNFFGSTAVPCDQWFTWTSSVTGTAQISTCSGVGFGASQDTKVAVYLGAGCPSGPAIACNDDDLNCAPSSYSSSVTWTVACGQAYAIQLGRFPFNPTPTFGTFTIAESGAPCPGGTAFCFGDGTGAACPCANVGAAGNGCASSVAPGGAHLDDVGFASIAADSLVLHGSAMPNSSCLYFQGTTAIAAGAGSAFGDGKRCAGGSVVRLGTKTNVGGASAYPTAGDAPISVRGMVTAPGTRTYQAWYRNAAAFCTASTFNLSNAVQIGWGP